MSTIFHSLVLNLHQPAHNLWQLLESEPWEAEQILRAIDRIPRALWDYEDVGRVQLCLSGTLLEQLADPAFQERVYGTVKCGDLLWFLQNRKIIRILGTGYYHPVIPLIPRADWAEQLARWQGIASHLFLQDEFGGFWPPEMGFTMEMIPLLRRLGYRYVLVDSEHVEPLEDMRWDEIRYRPHLAEYGGHEMVVVVRDRELSDAQESGMDAGWFMQEVHQRCRHATDYTPLVVTATDGDNGGWFRNSADSGNFWNAFYHELCDWVRAGQTEVKPCFISEYLDAYGTHGYVHVRTGAWNTGWHHGRDFTQWTGSQLQRDGLAEVARVSHSFHAANRSDRILTEPGLAASLEEAYWHILRAETSCNFFWGEDWVVRAYKDCSTAREILGRLSFPIIEPPVIQRPS